jgi:hypothetical protein
MTLKGQERVVAIHPATVIADADQLATARLHLDPDAIGPRIQRILKQLLDHARGPVYHLAGGNLIGYLI